MITKREKKSPKSQANEKENTMNEMKGKELRYFKRRYLNSRVGPNIIDVEI